jgi:maltose/moltooligosaccharide transporter
MYSVVCFGFSWMLPSIADRLGRRLTHAVCLLCGAAGLLSVAVIHDKWLLLLSMTGVGVVWASTLSMPYAILAGCLPPQKTGIYMGIFNFAIVLPEIIASLVFGWVMSHLLNNNRVLAVMAGGVFMILAAALMARVRDITAEQRAPASSPLPAGARH